MNRYYRFNKVSTECIKLHPATDTEQPVFIEFFYRYRTWSKIYKIYCTEPTRFSNLPNLLNYLPTPKSNYPKQVYITCIA